MSLSSLDVARVWRERLEADGASRNSESSGRPRVAAAGVREGRAVVPRQLPGQAYARLSTKQLTQRSAQQLFGCRLDAWPAGCVRHQRRLHLQSTRALKSRLRPPFSPFK